MTADLATRDDPEVTDLVPTTYLRADQHPVLTYLASLKPNSRPAIRHALALVVRTLTQGRVVDPLVFPWALLRWQHLEATLQQLSVTVSPATGRTYAPATVQRCNAAAHRVCRAARRLKLMDPVHAQDVMDVVPPRAGKRPPRARDVPRDELAALFALTRGHAHTVARDRALLALLIGTGLRRDEASALELADYSATDRTVYVARGKGDKARRVPVSLRLRQVLDRWVALRGTTPGPLLCPCTRRWLRPGVGLTASGFYGVLRKLVRRAGTGRCSPHDLRATFATAAIDAGGLEAAQELLGHASPATTHRYDRGGERRARAAVDTMDLPLDHDPHAPRKDALP